jgi:hypothetical protein
VTTNRGQHMRPHDRLYPANGLDALAGVAFATAGRFALGSNSQ